MKGNYKEQKIITIYFCTINKPNCYLNFNKYIEYFNLIRLTFV